MDLDSKDLSEKMLSTHRTTQPKRNIREIAMQLCCYIRTLHCTIHQYKIWPMSFSPLHRKRQRNQSFRYNLNETEKQKIHNQRFMNNDNVCRVQQRPKRHWLPVTRRASSRRLQHIPYRLKCSMYMKPDIETRCFCLLFFFFGFGFAVLLTGERTGRNASCTVHTSAEHTFIVIAWNRSQPCHFLQRSFQFSTDFQFDNK